MDTNKITILVLLDLSAAFDTVEQNRLINIFVNRFNIKGTALSWMKSYLTDRTQSILIGNRQSKTFPLSNGVAQGLCIGPIAFLVYISAHYDLTDKHNTQIDVYADDK